MNKRINYSVTYRSRQYDFTFRYNYSTENGYRAYIESMPSYGSRSESVFATHRLRSGPDYYICWSCKINTEAEMNAVVELWSKATVMYIAEGGSSINKYVDAIQNDRPIGDRDTKTYSVTYGGRSYDFVFHYEHDFLHGHRAFILSMPDYGNRSQGLSDTHRLRENGRYYVCWSDKLSSKEDLDKIVALWCKATVMYIQLGGTSIDKHAQKLMQS